MRAMRLTALMVFAVAVAILLSPKAQAEKSYSPGVSDTEIKIGQTMPYSGPASGLSGIGKVEIAYFAMVNDHGGVNGRKIKLISLDDGYNPARTFEQTRKLVEEDQVLMIFSTVGTPTNAVIQKYLNTKRVPQLFIAGGGSRWSDPEHFPWTMGWMTSYRTESHIYARYILENYPNAKIGVLYQNDDFGKDMLIALKEGLGARAATMIVSEQSYETTDSTVDSQIVSLKEAGADVLFDATTPKFEAQSIRKSWDIGWHPLHIVDNGAASVGVVLKPAGLEKAVGFISGQFVKDPADPVWKDDAGYQEWLAFMKKYYPDGDLEDRINTSGYSMAQTLIQVLKQCGDDLTRENVIRQAANLKGLSLPMLVPGISINTAPADFSPLSQMRLIRFDGTAWTLFGPVVGD